MDKKPRTNYLYSRVACPTVFLRVLTLARRACAARVTVVCVSVQNLTYRPTNDTTYLTGNEGQYNCAVFSENAPLQS